MAMRCNAVVGCWVGNRGCRCDDAIQIHLVVVADRSLVNIAKQYFSMLFGRCRVWVSFETRH